MKRIYNCLRDLWEEIRENYDDGYLTRSDKKWLFWGALMIVICTMLIYSLIVRWTFHENEKQYEKGLHDFLNTIAVYAANLTDEEFDAVTEELREQLAFTDLDADNDIEMYLKYIANTSESCPLEQENYPYRYYLVCTNNGEMKPIDYWQAESTEEGSVVELEHMWDEVSETSVSMLTFPNDKETDIGISTGRGTVSAHRMKQVFCDECIARLFDLFEETHLEEFFLFDSKTGDLYPIIESMLELDGYTLEIVAREKSGYDLKLFAENNVKSSE